MPYIALEQAPRALCHPDSGSHPGSHPGSGELSLSKLHSTSAVLCDCRLIGRKLFNLATLLLETASPLLTSIS